MKIAMLETLQALVAQIKTRFVAKDGTKVLTDHNFDATSKAKVDAMNSVAPFGATSTKGGLYLPEDKSKLDGVQAGAQVNVIETILKNGTALTVADKAVDIPVPTKISDLTNDTEHQSRTEILQLIASHSKVRKTIVDTLPAVEGAEEGVIYLLPKMQGDEQNGYKEYMVIDGAWEQIGDTDTTVDLTDYVKFSDLEAITLGEIQAAFA